MRIISIVGKKGGIGKTTSTVHIASKFADLGFKTCIIDLDTTQGNTTYSTIGPDWKKESGNQIGICQVLINGEEIRQSIKETHRENLWVIPSEVKNRKGSPYNVEATLSQMGPDGYSVLKESMEEGNLDELFDVVLIDNAPSLGLMTINSLVASDYFIMPVQANDLSVASVNDTIDICKQTSAINPLLKNLGIFVSLMDKRPKDASKALDVAHSIAKERGVYFFDTIIPVSSKFSYISSKQKTIFDVTQASHRGHKEYIFLVEEVARRIQEIDAEEHQDSSVSQEARG